MKPLLRLSLSLWCLLAAATVTAAQPADVSGIWDTTLTSPTGQYRFQIVVKRDNDQLSGFLKSQAGQLPLTGTITGKVVKIAYTVKFQGDDLPITLTGELDGIAMKGKADFGGFAEGDWSAKRAPAEAGTPATVAAASDKVDISGTWQFEVETAAGSGSPTFTFKQEGETLTGQYKGLLGEAPLTGTIKGNELKFSLKVNFQGTDVTVVYQGTVEKDRMKGTAAYGDLGEAKWTAKRQ